MGDVPVTRNAPHSGLVGGGPAGRERVVSSLIWLILFKLHLFVYFHFEIIRD